MKPRIVLHVDAARRWSAEVEHYNYFEWWSARPDCGQLVREMAAEWWDAI